MTVLRVSEWVSEPMLLVQMLICMHMYVCVMSDAWIGKGSSKSPVSTSCVWCCIIWAAPPHLADCQLGCRSGGILRLPCLSHHKAMRYLHGLACLPWQPEREEEAGLAAAWDSSSTGVKRTSLPTHTHTHMHIDTWKPTVQARVGYGRWLFQHWPFCEDHNGTCCLFIFRLRCQVSTEFA